MLSTSEVAQMKGKTRQAVSLAVKRGDLPALKVGKTYVVKESDAKAWQPRRTVTALEKGRAEQLRRSAGKGAEETPTT